MDDRGRFLPSNFLRRRSRSAHVFQDAHDFVQTVVSSEPARRLREQMKSKTHEVQGKVRQRTAKVGQHVREHLSHEQVVRFFDKTGFMLGVLGLTSTEFVFLRFPQFFWLWFTIMIPPLVAARWFLYKRAKHQFFLYDFCYFVQIGMTVNLFVFPDSQFLWRLHFVLAQGPLLWAIPAWRNSFVFHSLDKVTSVFIHFFPALLTYIHRWETNVMCPVGSAPCTLEWPMIFAFPVLYYFTWQMLYILKTEVLSRQMLLLDRDIATSVRWLATDRTHPMNVGTTWVCRRLRILAPAETLDPETWKTKVIFWTVQLLYTLVTFLPVKLSFDHQWICATIMWLCFCICVWNGANYYIEVFSKRYAMKFNNGAVETSEAQRAEQKPSGLSEVPQQQLGAEVPDLDTVTPRGSEEASDTTTSPAGPTSPESVPAASPREPCPPIAG